MLFKETFITPDAVKCEIVFDQVTNVSQHEDSAHYDVFYHVEDYTTPIIGSVTVPLVEIVKYGLPVVMQKIKEDIRRQIYAKAT